MYIVLYIDNGCFHQWGYLFTTLAARWFIFHKGNPIYRWELVAPWLRGWVAWQALLSPKPRSLRRSTSWKPSLGRDPGAQAGEVSPCLTLKSLDSKNIQEPCGFSHAAWMIFQSFTNFGMTQTSPFFQGSVGSNWGPPDFSIPVQSHPGGGASQLGQAQSEKNRWPKIWCVLW